jgi:hypothetical protein
MTIEGQRTADDSDCQKDANEHLQVRANLLGTKNLAGKQTSDKPNCDIKDQSYTHK